MNGPGNGRRYNSQWPAWLDESVKNNLWKLVTPALLTLAALTDSSKYRIDLVDEEFQNVNTEEYYDIVAMYTITPNINRAYTWVKHFKRMGSWVVLGGVHVSVCTQEACTLADTVLVGEGEYIWPQFLKDFELGKQKNIYIQPTGEVDLEHSPLPAFELIPKSARSIIPVQTARGCPHACRFCNIKGLYGKSYRHKSFEKVALEIEKLVGLYNRSTIYFTDDNLFCDKDRAERLLSVVGEFSIPWYTHSDISFGLNESLIKRAYKSGCRQVLIGFESITPGNLEGVDNSNFKMRHIPMYSELIDRIQSNGIGVVGSFIVGLDGDNNKSFNDLADFIFKARLYGASITVSTPFPGTELFKEMALAKRITTYDWDKYTIFQPVITSAQMSPRELNDSYIKLMKKINSQECIANRLDYFKQNIKNLRENK